jgi:hypothetical protein
VSRRSAGPPGRSFYLIERAGLHAVQDRLGPPERDLGTVVSDVRTCLELTDAVWIDR